VYDITSKKTLEHIGDWLKQVREYENTPTKLILVGNKLDLFDEREVCEEEAKQFAEKNKMLYIEASAKTGENVNDVFENLTREILRGVDEGSIKTNENYSSVMEDRRSKKSFDLSMINKNKQKKQKEQCCNST